MKENERKSKIKPRDFLRYSKGEMSDRERNSFEKELQRDPFLADAVEGFSGITTEEAEKDLQKLGLSLKSKITRRNRFLYLRIVASVALLLAISALFITMPRKEYIKER